jgi:RNA polymerase sigma factor (sigma-70 family)
MVGVSSGGTLRPLGMLFDRGTIGGKTDAELLELFAHGDGAEMAFEALVARHGPDVLRACRRILPDPNDADDAFQATFLVLARRASSGSIGRPDSIGPWLYGAALRVARKTRVAAARRRRHEQRVAARLEADSASRNDLADALRDEVERLPEPLRTPVVLCYLEDMSYQGAARRLDVSVGTIRGRLVKARGLLRSRLGQSEEFAADAPGSRGQGAGPVAIAPRPDRGDRGDRTGGRTGLTGPTTARPSGTGRRDHPRRKDVRPGRGGHVGPLGGRRRAHGRSPDDDDRDTMDHRRRDRGGTLSRRGRGRYDGRQGR